jgi:hypothetical protein
VARISREPGPHNFVPALAFYALGRRDDSDRALQNLIRLHAEDGADKFPKRRQLSANSVAWLESDISEWIDSRPVARLRAAAPVSETVAQRD